MLVIERLFNIRRSVLASKSCESQVEIELLALIEHFDLEVCDESGFRDRATASPVGYHLSYHLRKALY